MVFPVAEKKQFNELMWEKENKWHCRITAVWHGYENKKYSF